jgi:signal transduction histidine kinase
MHDLLLIAAYAAADAAALGLIGALVLRGLRHRSLSLSLAVSTAVGVASMVAGTVSVSWANLLPLKDLAAVILLWAMAGAVSLAVTSALGRRVAAGSKALAAATRALGDSGEFLAPADPPTAELTQLGLEWATTSAKLAAAVERERALEASRRELVAWISHDLRAPLAGLRAMAEALEDGMVDDPSAYHGRICVEVERPASW